MKHILLVFILFVTSLTVASAQREDCQNCGNVGTRYGTNTSNVSNLQISVYPNPFTDYISVKDNDNQINQIILFSITGKKVRVIEDVDSNERYYLADIQNGIYFVQLVGKNNKVITTQRMNKR